PDGSDVIVLEYAELGDLREYLKSKFANITWEEKIDISMQISNGLSFLHTNDILHRDLHTRNIVLSARGGKEKTIITGSKFKGWEKCCENYPHYSSIPRLLKTRTLSEPDSISLNLIANEQTTELLVNLQEIDKWCIEQPKNDVMKFIKQSAPNLAKLIEHKKFSVNENSFAHQI
ncbi:3643_t:CDS:2, partial [Acaulospora morrowiae]